MNLQNERGAMGRNASTRINPKELSLEISTADSIDFFFKFYKDLEAQHMMEIDIMDIPVSKLIGIHNNDFRNLLLVHKIGDTKLYIGFVGIAYTKDDCGFIQLYIQREYRGNDYGYYAIALLLNFFRELSVKYFSRFCIQTKSTNDRMIRIAFRNGFTQVRGIFRNGIIIEEYQVPLATPLAVGCNIKGKSITSPDHGADNLT